VADPLESFRRKPAAPPAKTTASSLPPGRETYQAFATKDRLGRLDIRTKDGLAHAPGSNYILDISYDRQNYAAILLVLGFMIVKITGRNLQPMVEALKLHTREFLAEFDPQDSSSPPTRARHVSRA
jgi:hypothetical protein